MQVAVLYFFRLNLPTRYTFMYARKTGWWFCFVGRVHWIYKVQPPQHQQKENHVRAQNKIVSGKVNKESNQIFFMMTMMTSTKYVLFFFLADAAVVVFLRQVIHTIMLTLEYVYVLVNNLSPQKIERKWCGVMYYELVIWTRHVVFFLSLYLFSSKYNTCVCVCESKTECVNEGTISRLLLWERNWRPGK